MVCGQWPRDVAKGQGPHSRRHHDIVHHLGTSARGGHCGGTMVKVVRPAERAQPVGFAHGKRMETEQRSVWVCRLHRWHILRHGRSRRHLLPTSLLLAILLTEYSRKSVRRFVYPLLDILASLPSVIFGVWGTLVVVPIVSDIVGPAVGTATSGYTLLSGSVVLSVMILPLLVSLFMEMFDNVGRDLRESSLALGATRWQTTKHVVLKSSLPA